MAFRVEGEQQVLKVGVFLKHGKKIFAILSKGW